MIQKRICSAPSNVTQAAPVRSAPLNHTALSALVQLLGCNLTTTLPQFRNGAPSLPGGTINHFLFCFPLALQLHDFLLTPPPSSKPEAKIVHFPRSSGIRTRFRRNVTGKDRILGREKHREHSRTRGKSQQKRPRKISIREGRKARRNLEIGGSRTWTGWDRSAAVEEKPPLLALARAWVVPLSRLLCSRVLYGNGIQSYRYHLSSSPTAAILLFSLYPCIYCQI